MRKMKKVLALMVTMGMVLASFSACGKTEPKVDEGKDATPTEAVKVEVDEATPVPEVVRDLGGLEITIGDWWSGEVEEPTTAQEEATLEYRTMIQEKYKFTMSQVSIGAWGDHQESFTLSTMSGTPKASIFIMDQSFVAKPLANNLFYDLSSLEAFDFTDSKWNESVINLMTKNGSVYGMATGKSEPRLGVFWNKRLFEENGLDPEEPYDLQASGNWTWAEFERMLDKTTVDKNNDGTIDTYGMASFSVDLLKAAAATNNATFVGLDENGKYYNATNTPEFLEAMQWGVSLIEKGYEMPAAEDAEWDWFITAFHDANVAMTVAEQYKVGSWADMEDDWGFVMMPAGPKGQSKTVFADNIVVIPSCFDKETAENIAFAYDLWTNPTPGYEDEGDWKSTYYTLFRDERAVDETLEMMYQPGFGEAWYLPLIYGLSYGDICYDVYGLFATPAEEIEESAGTWQAQLDDANN